MPEDTRTVRERAWSALERLAKAEQRRDATLSDAQAVVAAMKTPAGQTAVQFYYSAEANQTVAEASASARAVTKRRLGFGRWSEAVDLQVHVIMSRDQIDYTSALAKVEKEYPETWRAYLTERS